MFRVRPGVNWMLIAVGSWPYIRGTLSPSPPGAQRAPSHVPPRYTSLFNYDDDGPTDSTTPLWDRHLTPPLQFPYTYIHTYTHAHARTFRARCKEQILLLQRTDLVPFLLRQILVLALPDISFFFTCLRRYLDCALVLYDTFSERNDGHTDWPS